MLTWVMKCPDCGQYMEKEEIRDPWECPVCGWPQEAEVAAV